MTEQEKTKAKGGATPGLAIIGCLATGLLALIGGLMGLINENPTGAGICLVPAALAFGIVAYISFSD